VFYLFSTHMSRDSHRGCPICNSNSKVLFALPLTAHHFGSKQPALPLSNGMIILRFNLALDRHMGGEGTDRPCVL
jgi:hypothetical protein